MKYMLFKDFEFILLYFKSFHVIYNQFWDIFEPNAELFTDKSSSPARRTELDGSSREGVLLMESLFVRLKLEFVFAVSSKEFSGIKLSVI